MYCANVLLSFQNTVSSLCRVIHGYQILNGLCIPIMHYKSTLLDELVKQVNHNLQADNTDMKTTMMMRMNLMMNCLSESNFTKHLLTVYLFKTKNIFYQAYLNFVLKLETRQNFLF